MKNRRGIFGLAPAAILLAPILCVVGLACAPSGTGAPQGSGGAGPSGAGGLASGGAPGASGGSTASGGFTGSGGSGESGGSGGSLAGGGSIGTGGLSGTGGRATETGGTSTGTGGALGTGGRSNATGGATPGGGGTGTGGAAGGAVTSGPVGSFNGPLATGIVFLDETGKRVNAHGGGIIKEGDTYYLHGEYFPPATTTDGNFNGFSMYSSKDMATWKFERLVVPQQPSGELGPNRKGERPHIIKCPSSGEFVLYAHAADLTYQADKEIVYATSTTVNGVYSYKGPLKNASGQIVAHSDMTAYADSTGAYVLTESGHVYTLASDCHSWLSDKTFGAVNGDSGGIEAPTLFRAGSTYYWLGSYKTGWRANNNFYSTAPAVTGPWTYQGYIAPVTDAANNISDQRTWLSQTTWVQPVVGSAGTVYVFFGDHWSGTEDTSAPGKHNDQAGYVFQPLVFTGTKIGLPTYLTTWKLDVGAGTWSP